MIDLEKIRVHPTMYLRICKDIPLLSKPLAEGQHIAIYYEQSYHKGINDYILSHFTEIRNRLYSNDILFLYAPVLFEDMANPVQYFFPDSTECEIPSLTAEDFYKLLTNHMVDLPSTGRPMLLITDYRNKAGFSPELLTEDMVSFTCYDLDYADDNQFSYAIRHYLPPQRYRNDDIRFRSRDDRKGLLSVREERVPDADQETLDVSEIIMEINERLDKLYSKGVSAELLKSLLSLPEPKPSRLVITPDFRLLLPDYNNREIVLNPLPKALYFFYLRHTEGVLFKHLRDHRDEIFDLYSLLSPSENLDRMNQSIDDLVDSTKNSVNVLCSRIRAAFMTQFRVELARQYVIHGDRGEPKGIALDRKLVEDRSGAVM